MVIAFQSVVVMCVLVGVAYLVGFSRALVLDPDESGGTDACPDDRLRLGLAVPSNGQACGPS